VKTIATRGGDSVTVVTTGTGDPGYGHTSKVIAEIGRCLSKGECHHKMFPVGVGGVFTSATCCGEGLKEGLKGIMDFEVM